MNPLVQRNSHRFEDYQNNRYEYDINDNTNMNSRLRQPADDLTPYNPDDHSQNYTGVTHKHHYNIYDKLDYSSNKNSTLSKDSPIYNPRGIDTRIPLRNDKTNRQALDRNSFNSSNVKISHRGKNPYHDPTNLNRHLGSPPSSLYGYSTHSNKVSRQNSSYDKDPYSIENRRANISSMY